MSFKEHSVLSSQILVLVKACAYAWPSFTNNRLQLHAELFLGYWSDFGATHVFIFNDRQHRVQMHAHFLLLRDHKAVVNGTPEL